ncbi:hypothetical protein BMR1_01G03475 [Babesia microti strain RI]|uniref:Secreted protein n=1 Tax=Babesia microti (strain RI) TaxID=1133968 RepID=I7I8G2_BABMR|nr:hypothetical protein BMR1_01G03475 [Babesia microti strain RI]CCF73153.1 hypothetical protein BMR1_01G03475 [Babesia microti strain RI]|eukprot:XP_012647762.1 hypothetical protein BMR1_01G03475 [Babesia microti strain RI]
MRSSIIICVAAIFLSLVNILAATPNLPVDSYAFVDKKNAKLNKKRPSKPLRSRPVKKAVSRHKYNYKPKKTVANAPAKSNIKNPNARPSRNKLSGKPYGNKRVSKNPNTSRGKDWAKSGYSSNKTHKLKNKSELINSAVKGGLNLVTPIGTLGLNDLGASKDNNDDDDDDYDDFISGHGDNSSHKSSGKIAGLAANGWSSGKRSNDHAARGPKSDLEDDYTNDEGDDDTKSDLEDDYTNDEGDDYDTKSDLEDDYTNDEGDYDTKSDLEDDYTNDEGDYDTKSDLEDDYTNDEGDGDSVQGTKKKPKANSKASNCTLECHKIDRPNN